MNVERMPKEGEMPIVVKGSRFWEIGEGGAVGWMTFEHDSQCGAPNLPLLLLRLLLLLVLLLLLLDLLELRELL